MSLATDMAEKLKRAFPGIRVTSTARTRQEQDALVSAGKTRARNSQHVTGTGLDVVLPANVSPAKVRRFLSDQGVNPGEFINETGKGRNQGSGAHLHIGLAAKGGGPASSGGGSSFDRAMARRQEANGPSLSQTYEAYKNTGSPGGMTQQDAAIFENAVLNGDIILPRGAQIRRKPAVPVLPASVIKAHNSGEMEDDPQAIAEIKRALDAGEVRLPKGMTLQAPMPRTLAENYSLGAQAVNRGLNMPLDMIAGPVNSLVNAALGTNLSTSPFQDLATIPGAPSPRNDAERLRSEIISGAASAAPILPFAGGAVPAAIEMASGAAAGGSQEVARQAGAGPAGQLLAGLAGGLTPAGLAGGIERAVARRARSLPEVVQTTPRAAVVDDAGELTAHGQEIAARHKVPPEEVVAAYEAPPSVKAGVANDGETPSAARAVNEQPETPPLGREDVPPVRAAERTTVAHEGMPSEAAARMANAEDEGITLSRGQATRSFDIQDAETRLRNSSGAQADQARAFFARQVEDVKSAVERFKSGFGDDMPASQRGEVVREAIEELRDNGAEGVGQLYKQARDLGEPVELNTQPVRNSIEGLLVEADIPEAVKGVIQQEAMRYGLIGKPAVFDEVTGRVTNEAGVTRVKLDDGSVKAFRGEPQTLRLDNAEEFRKVISKQYSADGPQKLSQELKRVIDDAVEEAVVSVATRGNGELPKALSAARAAHVEQVKTFRAKDVIQDIIDWKKGTNTPRLSPEDVMKRALGKESDLKRIKAVLLSKPTVKSQAAWRGIQAHGLAELFQKATTKTTNPAGEVTDAISGMKLRSVMANDGRFPPSKLEILLDKPEFNALMKLRRSIEDATIPIGGTVNSSNSANLLMRIMSDVDNKVTGAFAAAGFSVAGPVGAAAGGAIGRTVSPAIKAVKEAKAAEETLTGIKDYTFEKAATDTAAPQRSMAGMAASATRKAASKMVSEFIEIYSNPRVIAPVLAASGVQEE